MANQAHKFKDRDVQRLIKAARSAGLDPVTVTVDPHSGTITVTSSKANSAETSAGNEDLRKLI